MKEKTKFDMGKGSDELIEKIIVKLGIPNIKNEYIQYFLAGIIFISYTIGIFLVVFVIGSLIVFGILKILSLIAPLIPFLLIFLMPILKLLTMIGIVGIIFMIFCIAGKMVLEENVKSQYKQQIQKGNKEKKKE